MITRRRFLHAAAATTVAGTTTLFSPRGLAGAAPERALHMHNLHTGERVRATFWADGRYVGEELAALDHFMRDFRRHTQIRIDRHLYDLLYTLQQQVGHRGTYELISGYRSPKTNAMLRRTTSGVAKRSLHTQGKAADIRLPGVELKHLRRAALSLHAGGVGYYPHSDFIHVDTGRPRQWRGA